MVSKASNSGVFFWVAAEQCLFVCNTLAITFDLSLRKTSEEKNQHPLGYFLQLNNAVT